ncbi:hypothetical protein ACL58G_24850 [Massilia sp. GER05]|uniref:hypothetical protein n=1 Tax=Massilia sp. GER05 TaxID=3394605 RepID=UPI003F873A19
MANGTLTVGQSLKIPAKAGATYNGAGTFKPYDAGAIVGNTTPEMALPVPQQSRGGCGGLGQLVMVVVAVVATIYTAGAAAGMLGASGGAWSAGLAVMQGAATGTIGTMGTVAAGAIGGAAGSIASQAVGMAIGAQDSFNWKGVALSAVGGGVSAGVASASAGTALGAKDIAGAIGRAALSNTISQGVGIVTGLQNGFSWRSVAASAAGAAAGYRSAQALQDFDMQDLFKQTATGMAAGATTAIARGGKFDIVRVATDAFGNALGNSLAYQGLSAREQKFAAMDARVDDVMADVLGNGERLVSNTAIDTRSLNLVDKLHAEEMARITSQAREEKLTWDSDVGGYRDADGLFHVEMALDREKPPVERADDLIEAAGGLAIETPLAVLSGTVASVVAPLYGVYTDIASGKFGTPEGIRIGEEAASQLVQRMTFKPQTATAQYVLGKAADFVSYSGIQGLGFSELSALRSASSTAPFITNAMRDVEFVGSGSGFKNPRLQIGAINPNGPKPSATGNFLVANHGDMPSPRPGQQSHHGVMSAWVKTNYPNYDPNLAPAILMPEANHRATFGVYNTWRAQARAEMGGTFDWSKVPETKMLDLSEKMFDAAKVPNAVRQKYWEQYVKMKGKLTDE